MTTPTHAILVWVDNIDLWAAPQHQPDAAVRFRLSDGGLAQALQLIGTYKPADYDRYERPQLAPQALTKQNLTLEDLAAAAKALRDLGIIR